MKWYRYRDVQPEDGQLIIQFENYHLPSNDDKPGFLGIRKYNKRMTEEEYKEYFKEPAIGNFWWCYLKDLDLPLESK